MNCRSLLTKIALTFALALFLPAVAQAEAKLPAVFGHHMVLQRDKPVSVWGTAEPGEKVTIALAGQTKTATADGQGNWSLRLDAIQAGGPHQLTVRAANTLTIEDVLVGEVWLCSGQSNMAMNVAGTLNAEEEIAAADYPELRMLSVARNAAEEPQTDCQGEWLVSSPETAGRFSATAFYFGRRLHQELDVPIGLINSSWGGTAVEAWTSMDAQRSVDELEPIFKPWQERISGYDPAAAQRQYERAAASWESRVAKAKAAGKRPPRRPAKPLHPRLNQNRPANLFNGMISPLVPYGLRGAIWYQGERNSNGPTAVLYGLQLQTLIADWRTRFDQGDFPFLFVQLPNFMAPQQEPSETSGWVMVREGMLNTLKTPNTGMAVTVDIGEEKDIHPKNKQDVGKRLAAWALATTYDVGKVAGGPIYNSFEKHGGEITLRFDNVGDGLAIAGGGPLKGFAVAGDDRKFVWADARIEGDKVIVSSSKVRGPLAVRYAWASNPTCNLANGAGIPASPFRTDDWVEPITGR